MKNILCPILFFISIVSNAQNNSIEFRKISENYIEIKTSRFTLDSGYSVMPGAWAKISFEPRPVRIKNGTVLIKDRLNRPLAIYVYSDSSLLMEEHYKEGQLRSQIIRGIKNSPSIEKYYWMNGNLQYLSYYCNGVNEVHEYSGDGQLIEERKK